MKIAVVGGGPSGLYFAMLVRKRQADWQVVVLEQNQPDATFGFGVVMAASGRDILRSADADTHDALAAKMTFTDRQVITVNETPIVADRQGKGGAIRRVDLLQVMQQAAVDAGVEVRNRERLADLTQLAAHGLADADLVVGADGINSVVCSGDEAGFGTERSQLTNRFAWYGVGKAFPSSALVFRKARGGAFVAHYYPYSANESTFVAECDATTWNAVGMEAMSPDQRRALFEEVFAPELGGYPLLSNNSLWRQFLAVRNERWVSGNKVLIGDAQTSAHFSIGSGTRIAMEDAIALAQAVCSASGPLADRLRAFESVRKPQKDKLISAAQCSYLWYEKVGHWMNCYSPHEFVYQFMMRTGRMTPTRLATSSPRLYAELHAAGVIPATVQTAA